MNSDGIPGRFQGRPRARDTGFSLIEVLVVVAIIALLVSVLIPSLNGAREQSRAMVCAANLGSTCRAEGVYQIENGGWIPGSPWTTGHWFLTSPDYAQWDPALPGFNRFAVNLFDQVTPLRAATLGGGSISRSRCDLIGRMTREPYGCPSSRWIASRWSGSGLEGPDFIPAPSHLTMNTLMRAGPHRYAEVAAHPERYPGAQPAGDVAQRDQWEIVVPGGYLPRHGLLGAEPLKVFVADGLRYYDDATGNVTYDAATNHAKGMTSATPPSTGGASFDCGREYNLARAHSYRHGGGRRIQAGFFDGHVEGLALGRDRSQTHFTGRAVHPQFYYPSRSVVHRPADLHLDSIPAGTVLP